MLKFSDGTTWDLDGEFRIKTDPDGFNYIHGRGVSIPIGFDYAEALRELDKFKVGEKRWCSEHEQVEEK